MIKEYGNMRKHKKKNTGRLKKNKKCIVRKYELLNDTLFLMSNLEGFGIFIHIFVGNRHFGRGKVLVQIIQFPHKRILFF